MYGFRSEGRGACSAEMLEDCTRGAGTGHNWSFCVGISTSNLFLGRCYRCSPYFTQCLNFYQIKMSFLKTINAHV